MEFGRLAVDFYGLSYRGHVNFYFLGLHMDQKNESYENDLDRIILQARDCVRGTRIQKVGLTLSPEIARQRGDVQSAVGDFLGGDFGDGLIFIPRPYVWLPNGFYATALETPTPRVVFLERFLVSLLERTGVGLLAYDLGADEFPSWERAYLEEYLVARRQIPTAFAEPTDKSAVHLLLGKPNSAVIESENGHDALEKLAAR